MSHAFRWVGLVLIWLVGLAVHPVEAEAKLPLSPSGPYVLDEQVRKVPAGVVVMAQNWALATEFDNYRCLGLSAKTGQWDELLQTLPTVGKYAQVAPGRAAPDHATIVWVASAKLHALRVTCDANQPKAPVAVNLPPLPEVAYEGVAAVAADGDGRIVVALKSAVLRLDPSVPAVETLIDVAAWKAKLVPAAEQQLLHGFGVRAVATTADGSVWALATRNSYTGNQIMDLWLLRRTPDAADFDVAIRESPSELVTGVTPMPLLLPMAAGVQSHGSLAMRTFDQGKGLVFVKPEYQDAVFGGQGIYLRWLDPFGPAPIRTLPRAPITIEGGHKPWLPGTGDRWWFSVAAPGSVSGYAGPMAPIAFDDPAGDLDRDGLKRSDEVAIGTSDLLADSDGDGSPDSVEAWRPGGEPAVVSLPPKDATPTTAYFAYSTRAMHWPKAGLDGTKGGVQPVLNALCFGTVVAIHKCLGSDGRPIGPAPPYAPEDVAFFPGVTDRWLRKADGQWSVEHKDGTRAVLPKLAAYAGKSARVVHATGEQDFWLHVPGALLGHYRDGSLTSVTLNGFTDAVVGYDAGFETMLVVRRWPGDQLAMAPDSFVHAADPTHPGGLRPLASSGRFSTGDLAWSVPISGAEPGLGAKGNNVFSSLHDRWWRPVGPPMGRPVAPLFSGGNLALGPIAAPFLNFLGAPPEFGADECPPWADPAGCGNPSLTLYPMPRYVAQWGELVPADDALHPGDVALWARNTSIGPVTPGLVVSGTASVWLHREDGGVHPWLTWGRWLALGDAQVRASLEQLAPGEALQIAIADDSSRLCIAADDGRVFEWTLAAGRPQALTLRRTAGARGCAYTAAGALVVATDTALEPDGAAPLPLEGKGQTLGVYRTPKRWLVHRFDDAGVPGVLCLDGPSGTTESWHPEIAAVTTSPGGVVDWVEAINTLNATPGIAGKDGAAWSATDDVFCNGQKQEALYQGKPPGAPGRFWHLLHAWADMIADKEQLRVLRGALARRPDGALLASSITPETRPRGSGGVACQCIHAFPARILPAHHPLPGATALPAHDGMRRATASAALLHPQLGNVTAMATAPGAVPADWAQAAHYGCQDDACGMPPGAGSGADTVDGGGLDADAGSKGGSASGGGEQGGGCTAAPGPGGGLPAGMLWVLGFVALVGRRRRRVR